jgi:hypothetical protein
VKFVHEICLVLLTSFFVFAGNKRGYRSTKVFLQLLMKDASSTTPFHLLYTKVFIELSCQQVPSEE